MKKAPVSLDLLELLAKYLSTSGFKDMTREERQRVKFMARLEIAKILTKERYGKN